jgi:hypothetical protein
MSECLPEDHRKEKEKNLQYRKIIEKVSSQDNNAGQRARELLKQIDALKQKYRSKKP